MKGGKYKETAVVTEEDIKKAENSLTKEAKKETENFFKEKLKEKQKENFSYTEDALNIEVTDSFSLAEAGKETETFNFQVKTKASTIIFKKDSLRNLVEKFIESELPKEKTFWEESLETESYPETINLEAGKIILSLDSKATCYLRIDKNQIKNTLKEKSAEAAEKMLENKEGIRQAEVSLWPFWVRSVPTETEKTKVFLRVKN